MEERHIDTLTHSSAPFTPEQRARKQQSFLKLYRECANIKAACKAAGISRQTFYEWQKNDSGFAAQLPEAEKDADDTAEFALYDRAIKGVESYVVSNGRVVYVDDKPLKERKYSDGLLTTLLKARMPEKYKDKQQIEHSWAETLNAEYDSLVADLGGLPNAGKEQAADQSTDSPTA